MAGTNFSALAAIILKGNDDAHVVVGPMAWKPAASGRTWYFHVSVSRAGEWFSIMIEDPDYSPPGTLDPGFAALFDTVIEIRPIDARDQLITALLAAGRPAAVHSFDDELASIRKCERLWPGQRVAEVRAAIEQERAQWEREKVS